MNTLQIGLSGERIAQSYLMNLGFKILERNFRIKGGELDIVAQKNDLLLFVEVKTRSKGGAWDALQSITKKKKRRLRRAINFYLYFSPSCPIFSQFRFDIIFVTQERVEEHLLDEPLY